MAVEIGVVLEGPTGESHLGTARNLGRDGLFVATGARFPVDTPLRVTLLVRDEEDDAPARPVALHARVRWIADPPTPGAFRRPAGLGLRFGELDPAARVRLETLLARLYAQPGDERVALAPRPGAPLG